MADENDTSSSLTPEDAMNRALAAEREAAEAILQCERESEQRISDARTQARQVAERTDARISRLQERCSVATRQRADALLSEGDRIKTSHSLERRGELLEQAVRQLAEELTTAEREEQDSGMP